jgi:hypothetical protein
MAHTAAVNSRKPLSSGSHIELNVTAVPFADCVWNTRAER